jgi:hypothetical protein
VKYTGNADGKGRHILLLPETAGRIGGVSPVLLPEEFQRVGGWVAGCEVVPVVEVPGGAEACAAALDWFADALPGKPVVLRTQTANERSMRLAAKLGFTEVERYEDYGAEQWFGVWSSVTPSG